MCLISTFSEEPTERFTKINKKREKYDKSVTTKTSFPSRIANQGTTFVKLANGNSISYVLCLSSSEESINVSLEEGIVLQENFSHVL